MFRRSLLLVGIQYSLNVAAQYKGGSNDGFNSASVTNQNSLSGIYAGGSDDGFSGFLATAQNTSPNIYAGGSNDGFSNFIATSQNGLPNIYTGGINDGFHSTALFNLNALPNVYLGGSNDGFDMTIVIAQNGLLNIYKGGNDDGFASIFKADLVYTFIGTGNWSIPSNWENNLMPPSPLPAGYEILIDPFSGSCILNVPQILSPGSKITVAAGKSFIIPGNIQ